MKTVTWYWLVGKKVKLRKAVIVYSRLYNFLESRFEIGGVETYIRNLCPILADCGLEPHAVFPGEIAMDNVIVDGIHLHSIKGDPATPSSTLVRHAGRIGDPAQDVLVFGSSFLISKSDFRRSIGIQHGIFWDVETFRDKRVVSPNIALLLRTVQGLKQLKRHEMVSTMICVDLNYVNWMRSLCISNRLPYVYIPNFAERAKCNRRLSRSKDRIKLVFARRFERIRGCELMLDVIPRVLEVFPNVEFVLAGDGSMSKILHDALDSYERVSFARYDSAESIEFHSGFDIAIVPSVGSEGTSLSLLEAMSAGCAVIATDVGGMSNLVLDGHNGILVKPFADDLFRAICGLISDSAKMVKMGKLAQETVSDSFSHELWENRWRELLCNFA